MYVRRGVLKNVPVIPSRTLFFGIALTEYETLVMYQVEFVQVNNQGYIFICYIAILFLFF